MLEWFSQAELDIMASVWHDRNRDNGSLLVCRYTPPKSLPSRSHTEEDKVNSITFRNGQETIVQAVPEPDSTLEGFIGIGRARCSPKDVYNPAIGQRVALARAMQDLAYKVDDEAQSRIVTWKQMGQQITEIEKHFEDNAPPTWSPLDNPEVDEGVAAEGETEPIIDEAPREQVQHNVTVSDEELRILMSIRARKERDNA